MDALMAPQTQATPFACLANTTTALPGLRATAIERNTDRDLHDHD